MALQNFALRTAGVRVAAVRALTCGLAIAVATDVATAGASVLLAEGVARSIRGEQVECVQVGKHGFFLRPIGYYPNGRGEGIVRTPTGLVARGNFRHLTAGKDDQVEYEIVAERGQSPHGRITHITVNGLRKNVVIGAVRNLTGVNVGDVISEAQIWRNGGWQGAAQQIVAEMVRQLALPL